MTADYKQSGLTSHIYHHVLKTVTSHTAMTLYTLHCYGYRCSKAAPLLTQLSICTPFPLLLCCNKHKTQWNTFQVLVQHFTIQTKTYHFKQELSPHEISPTLHWSMVSLVECSQWSLKPILRSNKCKRLVPRPKCLRLLSLLTMLLTALRALRGQSCHDCTNRFPHFKLV